MDHLKNKITPCFTHSVATTSIQILNVFIFLKVVACQKKKFVNCLNFINIFYNVNLFSEFRICCFYNLTFHNESN